MQHPPPPSQKGMSPLLFYGRPTYSATYPVPTSKPHPAAMSPFLYNAAAATATCRLLNVIDATAAATGTNRNNIGNFGICVFVK
jgi:hypothetical protein